MKQKWDLDEAKGVFWIGIEAAYALTQGMKEFYGFSLTQNVVIGTKDNQLRWYTLISELESIGKRCFLKFKQEDFRRKLIISFAELGKEISSFAHHVQSIRMEKINPEEVFAILEKGIMIYRKNFSLGFFAEPFDYVFPKIFADAFKDCTRQELLDFSAVPMMSFLKKEMHELLDIAHDYSDSGLSGHQKRYEWILSGHMGKKEASLSYFKARMKSLKEDKTLQKEDADPKEYTKKALAAKADVMNNHPFTLYQKTLIDIVNDIGPLHDVRKELFMKCVYYSDCAREEIGKRCGYSLSELHLFEYKELLRLRGGGRLVATEIAARSECNALVVDSKKGIFSIYSGSKAKKIAKEFEVDYSGVKEVKGLCASPGTVKGIVKVIFGEMEFHKMKKGDVLVTGMTRPELMPMIAKASAIITDEGGLTCHAAVVARELRIPCIIGTVCGTKVLKDNDLVEVLADSGIVRKI